MMLSAAYEAYLDFRVLQFLEDTLESKSSQITMDMRARLLFTVLIGNLDLNHIDSNTPGRMLAPAQSVYLQTDSPLLHIEHAISNLRTFKSPDTIKNRSHPSQWPFCTSLSSGGAVSRKKRIRCLKQTKTRLRTMLECQYEFVFHCHKND
jgi:hypothetical protein